MKILNKFYIFSKLQKVGPGQGWPWSGPRGLVQLKLALDPGPIGSVQAEVLRPCPWTVYLKKADNIFGEFLSGFFPFALYSIFINYIFILLEQQSLLDSRPEGNNNDRRGIIFFCSLLLFLFTLRLVHFFFALLIIIINSS